MHFPNAVAFPDTAAINAKGNLELGGCDVADLLAQYGSPLYVLDEATLRARCRAFRNEFQKRYPQTQIFYACKAFINRGLARLLAEEGLGFDVVSGGELAVVRAADVAPQRVYFHGNNKTPDELREALAWGIGRVVVDNFYEIDLLNKLAGEVGKVQQVLVRVSPGVDPHTHAHTTTGTLDSKFGFPLSTGQAREAVRQVLASPHLSLEGLHFHLGSPIFHTEPYVQATHLALEFAAQMREEGLELRELSPGGGFAIAYTEHDRPPSLAEYAEAIVDVLHGGCRDLSMAEPQLLIEPGRAIIGPAGVALYTVGSIKEVPGVRTFVSVDGGMGDNIRPALYGAAYAALAANRATEQPAGLVTIAGKFCESGDLLVRDVPLPALRPGDIIALPASGAYNLSMASNYNLALRPAVVMVGEGRAQVLRRRETYADLMRCDSE